ncbi:MAG: cysteine-rich CWC family protein [Nitrospiraceae bacterium]
MMKGPVSKTCEHCGQTFTCGGLQCWCGRMGITERQMDWIAARFQDCLCPACLEQVSIGAFGPCPEEADRISPANRDGLQDDTGERSCRRTTDG